ncbi:hypothetical protein F66182_15931, partial [Fusarium sp. NRRL 66182]
MCPPLQSPNTRPHRPGYFEQLRHNLATMDVAMICSRYGSELVALCIFLLVPISVVIVEIVDAVQDKMVIEKFPERGRGRIRLTEPERRMSVLAKCEREKMVRDHAQKSSSPLLSLHRFVALMTSSQSSSSSNHAYFRTNPSLISHDSTSHESPQTMNPTPVSLQEEEEEEEEEERSLSIDPSISAQKSC